MKRITLILFLSILCLLTVKSFSQTLQKDRIRAAYMITFGRDGSTEEINYWLSRGALTIPQLITYHQQYLMQDWTTHTNTINRSYLDALGRNVTSAEADYWRKGNLTYTALVKNHISWLTANPAEYEKVLHRSYGYVFNRNASAAEITWWKQWGVYSYLMLVSMHQDYKARQISKESGSGTLNLTYAPISIAVPLSLTAAQEARLAANLPAPSPGANIVAAGGGNIVAAGGGNFITSGRN